MLSSGVQVCFCFLVFSVKPARSIYNGPSVDNKRKARKGKDEKGGGGHTNNGQLRTRGMFEEQRIEEGVKESSSSRQLVGRQVDIKGEADSRPMGNQSINQSIM